MKRKDTILIIVAIFVSAVFSFILSNLFISAPKNRQIEVEVVGGISPDFPKVEKQFFNEESINPTKIIQIGPGENETPLQIPNE